MGHVRQDGARAAQHRLRRVVGYRAAKNRDEAVAPTLFDLRPRCGSGRLAAIENRAQANESLWIA